MKKILRTFGLELKRFRPETSNDARLLQMLSFHGIDLVLDVGANTGQFAKYLRELGYAGRIVSFEPLSAAHARLRSESRNDRLWEVAERTAIGERSGEITVHVSKNFESSSALNMLSAHVDAAPESIYVAAEQVPVKRLDEIAMNAVAGSKAAYLKIDVQGYEPRVLDGAERILPRIKGVQMELSLVPLYQDQVLYRAMLDKMESLGYRLHAIIPVFTDPQSGRLLQMDGIFFRDQWNAVLDKP